MGEAPAKTVTREAIYEAAKAVSNWGRWGAEDQIGTLNTIAPEDIVGASRLIRKGKVFSLALSLKEPIQSGLFGGRWNPIHTMLATGTDAAAGNQDVPVPLPALCRRRDQHALPGLDAMGRALPHLPR